MFFSLPRSSGSPPAGGFGEARLPLSTLSEFPEPPLYAIYVHIGKTGEVCSQPSQVSAADAKTEVNRSERIGRQLRPYDRAPGLPDDLDSEKLIALFRLLTGTLSPEDFNTYWWAK